MFSGIIRELGRVRSVQQSRGGVRLAVDGRTEPLASATGDSIAVQGVCLTAVELSPDGFVADVSPETLRRTTLDAIAVGDTVNLEGALRVGDAVGGHFVQGHVDDVGTVESIRADGNSHRFAVRYPRSLATSLVHKGSVAIDGVSLTVAELEHDVLAIALIPETWQRTTLSRRRPGERVNLETDMLGKYVQRYMQALAAGSDGAGIDVDRLRRAGFVDAH